MNKKITKIIIMLFMVMAFLGVSKNADAKDKYVTERGVNRNTTIKGISVILQQTEKLFIILQLLKKYRRMKLKIVFINMILKQVNIRKSYRENLILYVDVVEGIYIVE